ncbi:pyridoxal phosphate-dependent aminotransferase family protein [Microvirga sp. STR05]|uniref:Pyridoxal phosphate-dependent aminotransferase family protein n=1 Tax=Hymenobacter duratus TaxID=2771356 RepID=A0ABR8JAP5_9BACT|nr:aminotransferase class I/II-fold pyridoxal phosphate-dependent enzyme [Hymenobacter duratus]MBD2713453.1 pyridoxal phosphate-dependent aminotransferase family protein [Hymenobacter duratus]MBR7948355.1 pyridoxal phosphate-dependent aminotransferase family protein [Microvirga sp. STR05]
MDQVWETDQLPGRWLHHDGRRYLYCSGTGYLGIAHNPDFAALLAEGLARYGTNYGSSRNSNLRLRIYAEAEAYLTRWTGAVAALTVSSGYLAGQMAVKALALAGRFEYAPGTHPAAWLTDLPGLSSALRFDDWAEMLLEKLHASPPEPAVIVSNSLDPLRVQHYDFSWTRHLPSDRPLTLLIDDSHGFGVTGPNGAGIFPQLQVPDSVRVVVVSSLGKACGIPGGVVLSSDADFITGLQRSAYFAASSPIVPAYLHAFVRAAPVYTQARQQLATNVRQFSEAVAALDLFQMAEDFPVFFTPSNTLCGFLQAQHILISSFAYPTPTDARITRIVLSALHTSQDVAQVAEAVRAFADHMA